MSAIGISDNLSPVIVGDQVQVFTNIAQGFQKKPILKKLTAVIYGEPENPTLHVEIAEGGEMDDLKAIFMFGLYCLNTYQIMEGQKHARPN